MKSIGVRTVIIIIFLVVGAGKNLTYATDCVASASLSGVTYTINTSCAFGPNQPGFDTGTGTTNTSIMNITGQGVVITIDRQIGIGSATLPDQASIAIGTGGSISLGAALWLADQDGDTYAVNPATTPPVISRTQPAGRVRFSILSSHPTYDCADNYSDVWYPITACYADQDQDGYGASGGNMYTCMNNTTCAASTKASVGTGTHSSYAAYSTTNTDCKDTGTGAALVWVTASCYQDADNDNYGSTTAITCTDNATCTSATAGAVNAAGDAATGTFASVNTDCCDSSNIAYPGATTACTATALTGCTPAGGQYDYNCDGTSSKTGCTACYAQSGGQLYCRSNCSAYYYTGSQAACGASGKLRGTLSSCYPIDARGDCTADTGFEVVQVYKVGSSCTQGCR